METTLKKTVTVIVGVALTFGTKAQLKFMNSETQPITIAFAYYESGQDFKGFISTGWFKVEPHETITLMQVIDSPTYYYYAHDGKGAEWGGRGKYKFVVNTINAFKFKNGDMNYNENPKENCVFKDFKKVDVGNAKQYTLSLTEEED
ncbi:MAG TPA: DUF1036 domain-containing protein [Bacteroidia bacterium]|jgi:uncharacterized membrane protein|nr:DUF1036 domain-containing protein [Bacteroidia bacterium]